ncbi:competence type IV pilus minor pilin ComGD [Robertmurraya andreesenii]|uniref:Competence protein ComGD n=1 Tax=Anoxybacillus andreesenii TaxID=1325932 RepID=A0ABT9V634_9BACL|nr:competence type IV pilus minor pilin ComGD [Robertmurraya andreesenii]MDQ0156403.1 competence protein ComGD [Robertmurraya andreesenii]
MLLVKPQVLPRNEKGFTLIESLIVLSIFLLIISLSSLLLRTQSIQLEKQLFFTQLKADLLYAQQHAITSQKLVSVNFVIPEKFYYIRKQNGEILIKREYSDKITVSEGSQKLFFRYHSNGNISSFGSIYFYIDGERYQMTFQLGRGRFYVIKS